MEGVLAPSEMGVMEPELRVEHLCLRLSQIAVVQVEVSIQVVLAKCLGLLLLWIAADALNLHARNVCLLNWKPVGHFLHSREGLLLFQLFDIVPILLKGVLDLLNCHRIDLAKWVTNFRLFRHQVWILLAVVGVVFSRLLEVVLDNNLTHAHFGLTTGLQSFVNHGLISIGLDLEEIEVLSIVLALLQKSILFVIRDMGHLGELGIQVKVPFITVYKVACAPELDVVVHSLLQHQLWVVSLVLNLVDPVGCVEPISRLLVVVAVVGRGPLPCSGNLVWSDEHATLLDRSQQLVLVQDGNDELNRDVKREHGLRKSGPQGHEVIFGLDVLQFSLNDIHRSLFLFSKASSNVDDEVLILARVSLKLVLELLKLRIPLLSQSRDDAVVVWSLRNDASSCGSLVDES